MARPRVKLEKLGRFSRPPLRRMLQVHQQLKSGLFPNYRKLAKELEVSSKTVQRDIEFMRDQLGMPIQYDQFQFGFYYSEPVTSFPSIEVSEGELVALFVAQKALAQYEGTPFEKALKTAFGKIADGLQDKITFNLGNVDAGISFKGIGTSVADIDLFEIVSTAVLRSHELVFEYKKLGSSRYEERRVQPYHLGCVENQWYLFGFDLLRQQLRTFALPRMRKGRNSGMRFQRPADFSITKHLSESFGVFTGSGRHRVRIHFDAFAARLVGERQWHASQKIKPVGDREIEITMELDGLEEIERWILSWGVHARVIEPKELMDRIRSFGREIEKIYPEQTND